MTTLPPLVVAALRLVIPARRLEGIVLELEEDYARVRSSRGAVWWLLRETASLLVSYALQPLFTFGRTLPMWVRDAQMVIREFRRGAVSTVASAAMLSSGLLALLIVAGLATELLVRPVSARHGFALKRVVAVGQSGRLSPRLSYAEVEVVREHAGAAATLAAAYLQPVIARTGGVDRHTMAEVVDGSYFDLVGLEPLLGRGLSQADDRPDAPPAAVISEPLWRRVFDSSPTVLGAVLVVNQFPFVIVGVADTLGSRESLGGSVDVWTTLSRADPILDRGWRTDPDKRWLSLLALPRSGAELDTRLDSATADLTRRFPAAWTERRLEAIEGSTLIGAGRAMAMRLMAVLGGLAALILATAASNIGGLFLARAAATRRHIAVQLTLGAGRASIVRRWLLAGAAVGVVGGVLSIGLYAWARVAFEEIALLPTFALRLRLPLDATLVSGTVVVGALTGILLAAGPGVWASRPDAMGLLRDGSRTTHGPRFARIRGILVAAQVALSLTLIAGAALFARSADRLENVDLGFPRERLVAMDFDLEPAGLQPTSSALLAKDALARARSAPAIGHAAMASRAPVDASTPSLGVHAGDPSQTLEDVTWTLATGGYFETVGLPLVAGRSFYEDEAEAGRALAVVSQTLASSLWPGADPIGRPVFLSDGSRLTVVGVARDSKYRALDEPARPHVYRAAPPALGMTLLARADTAPRAALTELQRALDTVGPGLMGFFPRTMDDHLAVQLLPVRATARAARGLGLLALALCGAGLYGLLAWFVEQRQRELGVRMALGATPQAVRRLVVRRAFMSALPGIVGGLALSAALGFLARSALFGVGPVDPVALATGALALLATVSLAAYVPSLRASRVEPALAFRE